MKTARRALSLIFAILICAGALQALPSNTTVAKAAAGFTVMLNPGHGPASSGNGAIYNGVKESLLNERLTAAVVTALKARGVNVMLTNKMTSVPNDALYVLDESPQGTNGSGTAGSSTGQYHFKNQLLPAIHNPSTGISGVSAPDIMITIHHNSSTSPVANGYEIYYSSTLTSEYGKTSDTVQKSSVLANLISDSFAQPGFYLAKRSISVLDRDNNSLTKYCGMPSVLVEAGFMSNDSEFAAITQTQNMDLLAERLADAVVQYMQKYGATTGQSTPSPSPSQAPQITPEKVSFVNAAPPNGSKGIITATDLSGYQSVKFAVWPITQYKKIKWLVPTKVDDSTYTINVNTAEFGNIKDKYIVHVYGYNNTDKGIKVGTASCMLGAATASAKPSAQATQTGAANTANPVVTFKNSNPANGKTAVITAKGLKGYTNIRFAVWPVKKKSALKWVKPKAANGTYTYTVNIKSFANVSGDYTVHVYGKIDGKDKVIKGASCKIMDSEQAAAAASTKEITVTFTKSNAAGGTSGTIKATGLAGYTNVRFAVWPVSKPSLRKWLKPTGSNGAYTLKVSTSSYGKVSGKYVVHVYGKKSGGKDAFIKDANCTLGAAASAPTTQVSGAAAKSVVFTNDSPPSGTTGTITASGLDGYSDIRFAVWPKTDDSKIKWLPVNGSTGKYTLSVSTSSFGDIKGTYLVHVYGKDSSGADKLLCTANCDLGAEPEQQIQGTYQIMGKSTVTANQLANHIIKNGWSDAWYGISALDFANKYINYCEAEGVKAEVAWAQMCHETNYLKFTGSVSRDQYNFAGMGATGNGVKGLSFKTLDDGIKSQIQHLKRYASTEKFNLPTAENYDRYKYITAGCAPTVEMLVGKWAVDTNYANALLKKISDIKAMPDDAPASKVKTVVLAAAPTSTVKAAPASEAVAAHTAFAKAASAPSPTPGASAMTAEPGLTDTPNSAMPSPTTAKAPMLKNSRIVGSNTMSAMTLAEEERVVDEPVAVDKLTGENTLLSNANNAATLKDDAQTDSSSAASTDGLDGTGIEDAEIIDKTKPASIQSASDNDADEKISDKEAGAKDIGSDDKESVSTPGSDNKNATGDSGVRVDKEAPDGNGVKKDNNETDEKVTADNNTKADEPTEDSSTADKPAEAETGDDAKDKINTKKPATWLKQTDASGEAPEAVVLWYRDAQAEKDNWTSQKFDSDALVHETLGAPKSAEIALLRAIKKLAEEKLGIMVDETVRGEQLTRQHILIVKLNGSDGQIITDANTLKSALKVLADVYANYIFDADDIVFEFTQDADTLGLEQSDMKFNYKDLFKEFAGFEEDAGREGYFIK